ncbi:hypothetical protein [Streptomyces acidiscabies]|uniref:hypothetical protein n=1 Tax=Streptomyces acidiscabies TaxID=42234 RepID=UPI000A610A82|nr:hypothetical protein [Streptomyces acidiscabies]
MDENVFDDFPGSGRDKSALELGFKTAKNKAELFDVIERFPEMLEKPDLDLPDEEPPSL